MVTAFNSGLVDWATFVKVLLVVLTLYVLLVLLRRRLDRGLYLREADGTVRAALRVILLLIDPLAILVLAAVFVAIWPALHGLILGLIVLLGFPYIRDFVAGRVFRFDRNVRMGRQIKLPKSQGTVANLGLTALYIQHEQGRSSYRYSEVLQHGYTLAGDPRRGGFFHLQVLLPNASTSSEIEDGQVAEVTEVKTLEELRHALIDNPYVRQEFHLEVQSDLDSATSVDISIGVHRAEHVQYLIDQLREQGFNASLLAG